MGRCLAKIKSQRKPSPRRKEQQRCVRGAPAPVHGPAGGNKEKRKTRAKERNKHASEDAQRHKKTRACTSATKEARPREQNNTGRGNPGGMSTWRTKREKGVREGRLSASTKGQKNSSSREMSVRHKARDPKESNSRGKRVDKGRTLTYWRNTLLRI